MAKLTHMAASTAPLKITAVDGEDAFAARLSEYGLIVGLSIQLLKKLPFHGPLIVMANNMYIALRFEEADRISVAEFKSGGSV